MKIKAILCALLASAVVFGASAPVLAAAEPTVTVNGRIISWERGAAPYGDNGGVMLPLRQTAAAMGGLFEDEDDIRLIYINGKILCVMVGEKMALVSDLVYVYGGTYTNTEPELICIDRNVIELNGDIFFPLAYFSSIFGIEAVRTGDVYDFIYTEIIPGPVTAPSPTPAPEPAPPAEVGIKPEPETTPEPFADAENIIIEEDIKLIINGENMSFDAPPRTVGGRVMAPVRGVFEALGAEVFWDEETQTITARRDAVIIVMQIGNAVVTINGYEITLDVPPRLVGGLTYVPVRAVAEGLDADVYWDNEARAVIVTREE